MQLAREKTKDGKELIKFALGVLRAEVTQTRYTLDGTAYEQPPSIKDRLQAMEFLADRGFGKAVETVDLKNSDGSMRTTVVLALAQALQRGEVLLPSALPSVQSNEPISQTRALQECSEVTVNVKA